MDPALGMKLHYAFKEVTSTYGLMSNDPAKMAVGVT